MQTRRLFRVTQVTEGTSANVSRTQVEMEHITQVKNLFFCLFVWYIKFPGSD